MIDISRGDLLVDAQVTLLPAVQSARRGCGNGWPSRRVAPGFQEL